MIEENGFLHNRFAGARFENTVLEIIHPRFLVMTVPEPFFFMQDVVMLLEWIFTLLVYFKSSRENSLEQIWVCLRGTERGEEEAK